MATVSENAQHGYADADEFIQYQLGQARSRIKATDLLTASVLAGLLLVGYLLIFTLLDHWVIDGGFDAWTRAGMLVIVVSLCAAILFGYVLRPWFRTIHPLYAARMLDRSSQGLEGSLMALVDLQAGGLKVDSPIQRSLEKRAAVKLAEVHVDEAIDRRLLIRLGTALFAVTLMTCLYAVFSPKSISLLRPLTLATANVATRTVVESVQPGNKKVPAGSQIEFLADISGVIPEDVRVLFTTADRRFVDEPLKMRSTDDQNRFQALMVGDGDRGIRQNLRYRVVAGDATSELFTIAVDQPPTAQVLEVKYQYPTYMNLPERVDSSGTIEAWEDSTVTIFAESNVPVESAILQLSDDAAFTIRGEELSMSIKDRSLLVELKLKSREDGSLPKFYRIMVADADGNSDPEPVVYAMEIRRDQPPVVKLLDPTRDLQVAANAIIPLLVEAEDPDFLLRSVTLHYSVNGTPVQPSEVLLDTSKNSLPKRWAESWDFRLAALKLNPGDIVTYHVQARDNRPPLGNQSRTGDLNVQVTGPISDQAVQEQLAEDRDLQQQQLKDRQAAASPLDESAEPQNPDESNPPPEQNPAPPLENPKSSDGNPNSAAEGSATERQPGAKPEPERPDKRRADDDEALQKLIQELNRKGNQVPDDSGEASTPPQSGNRSNESSNTKKQEPDQSNGQPVDSQQRTEHQPGDTSENQPTDSATAVDSPKPTEPGKTKEPASEVPARDDPERAGEASNQKSSSTDGKKDPDKEVAPQPTDEPSGKPEPNSSERPKAEEPQGTTADTSPEGSAPKKSEQPKLEPKDVSGASKKPKSDPSKPKNDSSQPRQGDNLDQTSPDEKNDNQTKDEAKSGEAKSGEAKSGEAKSGEAKSGEAKSGEAKSGEAKSGEAKSGEAKSGEAKSGEAKSGESKSGAGKSAQGKPGDGQPGEAKPGQGQPPNGKPGSGSGKSSEGKSEGSSSKSGSGESTGQSNLDGGNALNKMVPNEPDDSSVDEAAQAAGLALRRLEKELDRGTVDPKLLEELGWTREELNAFRKRMQDQLNERQLNEQQQREKNLSQKSFEEMLRSLDVQPSARTREGRTDKDRDQQDTTSRQSIVPKQYEERFRMYQRSMSGPEGKDKKN